MPDANPDLMTVFAEALERTDPAERAAYLDGACGDDAALRRRVEALLAAHDGAGRFLEGDPAGTSEPTSAEAPETIAASVAAPRLPSEPATAADGSDGAAFTVAEVPRADRTGGFGCGPGHCRPVHAARSPRRGGDGHRLPRRARPNRSSGRWRSS